MNNQPDTSSTSNTRWSLFVLMLIIAVIQLGNGIRMLQLPQTLKDSITLSPILEIAMNVIWIALASWVMYGLLKHTTRAVNRAFWVGFGFILYSIFRLLLFARADYDRGHLPFLLIVCLITLFVFCVVYLVRRTIYTVDDNS